VSVAVERALCDHFGHRASRASVSFLGVEPIEVLRFEPIPGEQAYLSLGMSRRPMTGASEVVVASDGPRAELMLHVRDGAGHKDLWRQLAVLAASPAVEGVVYVPGMTVDLGQSLAPGSGCTGVVVAQSALAAIETPDGNVAVLQVLPATSSELAWCRVRGAAALRERWMAHQVDLLDLARRAVALD
jgi:Suppressor of fused protein (SUFU)